MKKVLSLLLPTVFIVCGCRVLYSTSNESYAIEKDEARLDRGKHLTMAICAKCHTGNSTDALIGERITDFPRLFGKVYSKNITGHKEKGIGNYTDAELSYLIKTGIAKNGRFIPYMLRPTMADEDVDAIITYLRSDDEPVKPVDSIVGKTHYSVIGKLAMNVLGGKPFEYKKGYKRPSSSDSIATGAYLVDVLGCFHCHSKNLTGLNYIKPEKTKGYMAGGLRMKMITGEKIHASNLTPDKATGIGNYSKEDFTRAVKTGISKENKILRYPMQMYGELEDEEVVAIYAYLHTLKPVTKKTRH